jgi:diguanylate cyclase (GGDEF)-like protein
MTEPVLALRNAQRLETQLRLGRAPQRLLYPVAGAFLASGAPLGLLLVRLLRSGTISRQALKAEIRSDLATYGYVTITTMIAFAAFARFLGTRADRLVELSVTDSLTGLMNLRTFRSRLAQELSGAWRSHRPLSVIVVDLDGLKEINDNYGHEVGDQALRDVGRCLRGGLRVSDMAARIGGDEFALLAPDTSAPTACSMAERMRASVATALSMLPRGGTASAGVVTFDAATCRRLTPADLMKAADRALYDAKRSGRNRVRMGAITPRW